MNSLLSLQDPELDACLAALAQRYNSQHPPEGALARLKTRFRAESRELSDDELEWLAAAGTTITNLPTDKE